MSDTDRPDEGDEREDLQDPGSIEQRDEDAEHAEGAELPPDIENVKDTISSAVDRSTNDPAQLVSAALQELERMGITFPEDTLDLIRKRSDAQSRVDAGEDFSEDIDFEAAVLSIVEDGEFGGEKIQSLLDSLESSTPEDARGRVEDLKKRIDELEKSGASKEEINRNMQNEMTALLSELGTLRGQAQQSKVREIVRSPFYVKILTVVLLVVIALSVYENYKQRKLLEEVQKEHVPMLVGERELDWAKIEADIKGWVKKYEEEFPDRPATAEELEDFINRMLPDSKKGKAKLIKHALQAALLSRDSQLAYKKVEGLRVDSEEARDRMIEGARTMVLLRRDLLKALGNTWLSWGVASKDKVYGGLFSPENRDKFLENINVLLNQIVDEMRKEKGFGEGVPRPWSEDEKSLTMLKKALDALRLNNCPLDEQARQFIMSYE
jgi:hypothetical protein